MAVFQTRTLQYLQCQPDVAPDLPSTSSLCSSVVRNIGCAKPDRTGMLSGFANTEGSFAEEVEARSSWRGMCGMTCSALELSVQQLPTQEGHETRQSWTTLRLSDARPQGNGLHTALHIFLCIDLPLPSLCIYSLSRLANSETTRFYRTASQELLDRRRCARDLAPWGSSMRSILRTCRAELWSATRCRGCLTRRPPKRRPSILGPPWSRSARSRAAARSLGAVRGRFARGGNLTTGQLSAPCPRVANCPGWFAIQKAGVAKIGRRGRRIRSGGAPAPAGRGPVASITCVCDQSSAFSL